jgi:hypothetical protein
VGEVALHIHHDEGGAVRLELDWRPILRGNYGNDLLVFVHDSRRSRKILDCC